MSQIEGVVDHGEVAHADVADPQTHEQEDPGAEKLSSRGVSIGPLKDLTLFVEEIREQTSWKSLDGSLSELIQMVLRANCVKASITATEND